MRIIYVPETETETEREEALKGGKKRHGETFRWEVMMQGRGKTSDTLG